MSLEISASTTMGKILSAYPSAKLGLFRRYHIGGCTAADAQGEARKVPRKRFEVLHPCLLSPEVGMKGCVAGQVRMANHLAESVRVTIMPESASPHFAAGIPTLWCALLRRPATHRDFQRLRQSMYEGTCGRCACTRRKSFTGGCWRA